MSQSLCLSTVTAGPSPAGGAVVPGPHLRSVPPISRLAPRLLHASNTVFLKCGPLLVFDPFVCFFAPPAAKSWRRACVTAAIHKAET